MKKFLSILLVLTMVLSLGITALADEGTGSNTGTTTGSITITNPTLGYDYYVYKIFDATYDKDNKAVSYTIDPDSQFYSIFFDGEGKQTGENKYFILNLMFFYFYLNLLLHFVSLLHKLYYIFLNIFSYYLLIYN